MNAPFEPARRRAGPRAPAHDRVARDVCARHGRVQPDGLPRGRADRRPGQRRGPDPDRRRAARLGRRAGLDRARADVAQARRRHRGDLRRGVPALQPGAREPHGRLLLVGLGPDLRLHRDPLGHRAARVVPAVDPGHAARDRRRAGVRRHQPARRPRRSRASRSRSRASPPCSPCSPRSSRSSPARSTTPAPSPSTSTRRSTGSSASSPPRWPGSTSSASPRPPSRPPTCHVGETKDPTRNVPRAVFASGAMAGLFFVVLPLVWLGSVGPGAMGGELMPASGPTFAPLLAGAAKAAAIWFLIANMFMGTMQPLAGASRTLSQLSEDGLLPRSWANRNRRDVPWIPTLLTAGLAIGALAARRPDLDDRGRELHLPDRHQPAVGRGPAAAPQRARARPALPRAARDDRARGRRRLRVAARHLPRLRAVRPPDRAAVARPRLRRLDLLRLAPDHRPPPRRPARRPALAEPQAHRRDGRRDGARRRRLPAGGQLRRGGPSRADLAAPGHLRRGRDPHDHRRPRPPGHHRPGGRADLRRRRAPGHRHARRPDAGDARAQHRRPRRRQGARRRRPRRRPLARRGRRARALLQPDAGRGRPRRRGARRRPRGPARRPRPSSSATSPSRPPSRGSGGSRSRARTSAACCRRR